MATETGKKLSYGKRALGLFIMALVGIVSFLAVFLVFHFSSGGQESTPSETPEQVGIAGHIALIILTLVFGFFFFGLGALLYMVILYTRCFTFNFAKPFWNGFKKKLYAMHMVVTTLIGLAVAAFVLAVAAPILMAFGVSLQIAFMPVVMVTFVLTNFLHVWVYIWQPLDRSTVKKRLSAYGISDKDIERGICVGISDPAKSSFKKLTMIEEDVGMLWLEDNELVYRGDTGAFEVSRSQLIEIERAADAGSTSSYGGNVNVILRFTAADGSQRRVRLHTEGEWTAFGKAKASDMLAQRLNAWKQGQYVPTARQG